ncbi:DUF1501 domain-containing protein [bacterium]|nr:DUF1501 domain-containing protein [bacterium]
MAAYKTLQKNLPMLSRRSFLQASSALTLGAALCPRLLLAQSNGGGTGKNVIVINLYGGIDGVGAFPFYEGQNANLLRDVLRPTLHTPLDQIIPHVGQNGLANKIGFHPAWQELTNVASTRSAIIQAYGIPGDPGRSHDTCQVLMSLGATQIQGAEMVGFLARLMDSQDWESLQYWALMTENPSDTNTQKKPPLIVSDMANFSLPRVGWESEQETLHALRVARALVEVRTPQNSVQTNYRDGLRLMHDTVAVVRDEIYSQLVGNNSAGDYLGNWGVGASLRDAAKIIKSKAGSPRANQDTLILLGQGGHDTHSDQIQSLPDNIGFLAHNLAVFYRDLELIGALNDTVIVLYSEFGRTCYENGTPNTQTVGTDHGHGSNTIVLGGPVRSGVYGDAPSSQELTDSNYNALRPKIDFRDVFSEIFAWMGIDARRVFDDPNFNPSRIGFLV